MNMRVWSGCSWKGGVMGMIGIFLLGYSIGTSRVCSRNGRRRRNE